MHATVSIVKNSIQKVYHSWMTGTVHYDQLKDTRDDTRCTMKALGNIFMDFQATMDFCINTLCL